MNFRIILRLLGIISLVIGGSMLLPLAWAIYGQIQHGESDLAGILTACLTSLIVGAILYVAGRSPSGDTLRREGIAVVGLGWLLAAALGALPYVCTGEVPSFVDAYFESMSGFTTTGSSILVSERIDALPHGVQFWRCFTQWLGGMGIVVLFVAIIPFLRASGKQLFFTEVPGPLSESLHPRVRDTAIMLWKIYMGFTIILTLVLYFEGMTFFEAVCHACTTMSTGGFSTRGVSVGGFDSMLIEATIIAFMFLAGINFGIYYRVIHGDWKILFRDPEVRFYGIIVVLCIALVSLELWLRGPVSGGSRTLVDSVRDASFQTVAVMTTTGYGTDDFNVWPNFSKCAMVVLMFFGGCAGSTAGGMKVIRILVLSKHALMETEHVFRPQTVRSLRIGKAVIEEQTRWTILAFFSIVIGTTVFGTLVMAALGMDLVSAMTAVATTLNNIGPGLNSVYASFADVPDAGKFFLSILMAVGRLEVFAILVLFSPGLWRSH